MSRPRILCLMQLPPPVHGASLVNSMVASSAALASRFELDVLPLRFATSIEDVGRAGPRKAVRAIRTTVDLQRALRKRRPDLVYFTFASDGPAFYRDCAFAAVLKAAGVRAVYHFHGNLPPRAAIPRALLSWAVRGTSVIHLSPRVQLQADVLAQATRVLFVPNGVPDRARHGERRAVKAGGPVRLLFLSNMLEEKGPLVLAAALTILARAGVDFQATLAGAPVPDTVSRLERTIREGGLSDRVSYVGAVHGEAKDALFREHDVFVFPTYYGKEILPLVLLEAMQSELPVVTTPVGAIPDVVIEDETGLFVPVRDAHALASKLRELIENPQRRLAMGRSARARYLEHYTVERFEAALASALETCLNEG